MIKKINSWLVILILIMMVIPHISRAQTLNILDREAPSGNLVQVPITFTDIQNLTGLEIIIQYDTAVLDFVKIDTIGMAGEFLTAIKLSDNKIAVSMARSTGLGDSKGTLFGITFRIKSTAQIGINTDIFWIRSQLYNENTELIPHQTIDGKIKISEFAVFPNVFTPNRDGFNDVVNFIVPESMMGNVTVKIFGISGNMIRKPKNANQGTIQWDGLDEDGDLSLPGVYLYLILNDENLIHKGTITLMR